jgi:hypothetical protein
VGSPVFTVYTPPPLLPGNVPNGGAGNPKNAKRYQRALKRLKGFKTTNQDCLSDLTAVGLSPAQVQSIATGAHTDSYLNSGAANIANAIATGADMLADSRSQTIYLVSPNLQPFSQGLLQAELLHEIIHLSGFGGYGPQQDAALDAALGQSSDAGVDLKLDTDCFNGK